MNRSLSIDGALSGGSDLGSLSSIVLRYTVLRAYANITETISGRLFDKFIELYAIICTREFGYIRGKLSDLNSGGEVPKTIF